MKTICRQALGLGLSVDLYSLNALSAFQLISEFQQTLTKSLFIVIVVVEPSELERYGIERSGRSRASAHLCESYALDLWQSLVDLPFFLLGLWLRKFVS